MYAGLPVNTHWLWRNHTAYADSEMKRSGIELCMAKIAEMWQKHMAHAISENNNQEVDNMEMNSANVEAVVKQVLESMLDKNIPSPSAPAASQAIPKTAHVAMLTSLEHYDVKEFPIPEVGRRRYPRKSRGMRYLWNRCP